MQYLSKNQPSAIKIINKLGRLVKKTGLEYPTLEPKKLIDSAIKRTGFSDFGVQNANQEGGQEFMPGLEKLCDSLQCESKLSQIGRIAVRAMLLDNLCLRLQLTDYRKKRPEVAQQRIVRPLFVVGLPRTGTTILYELLAQDPNHRSPVSWEVASPIPPAKESTYFSDSRIAILEKQLAQTEMLAPGLKAIHELGALLPQECVTILASHFISEQYGITFFVPQYRRWILDQDMTAAYRWHKQFLQHLQVDFKKPRWVLKTPAHLPYLDAFVAQYPDAAIVQTHRQPMEVMGSISSLACTLRSAFSDDIDPIKMADLEVKYFAEMLKRGIAQRDAMQDNARRFYDIQFTEIINDPITAIEKMYHHFDFEFSVEARQAMTSYLDKRPRQKHGQHQYTVEQFGLNHEQHGSLFDEYCQRFNL